MTPNPTVEWITDEARFLALRKPWSRLVPDGRGVFLRHEWFDAAWQWRKDENCGLRIVCVYRGHELIGVCPLILLKTRHGGLPARKLEFLSVPDTQFCDLICHRAESTRVCGAVAGALRDRAHEWDVFDLRHLSPDGVLASIELQEGLAVQRGGQPIPWDTNPFIDLTESWDTFYSGRTRSLKKANNLAVNRLRKAGELEIQWLRGPQAAPDAVAGLLDDFIAISAKSWKAATGLTLNNPGPGAFIRRLTQHALEQGWLSMWGLRLNGKVVAMEYQLISGGEVFALRADFDGSLDAISPGSYLSWQLLQELFGSGLTRYWMGPGANAYKGRWTDRGEQLFRAGAYSPTIRGRLHQLNDRVVRPAARTALHVLRASTRAQAGKGAAKK